MWLIIFQDLIVFFCNVIFVLLGFIKVALTELKGSVFLYLLRNKCNIWTLKQYTTWQVITLEKCMKMNNHHNVLNAEYTVHCCVVLWQMVLTNVENMFFLH